MLLISSQPQFLGESKKVNKIVIWRIITSQQTVGLCGNLFSVEGGPVRLISEYLLATYNESSSVVCSMYIITQSLETKPFAAPVHALETNFLLKWNLTPTRLQLLKSSQYILNFNFWSTSLSFFAFCTAQCFVLSVNLWDIIVITVVVLAMPIDGCVMHFGVINWWQFSCLL